MVQPPFDKDYLAAPWCKKGTDWIRPKTPEIWRKTLQTSENREKKTTHNKCDFDIADDDIEQTNKFEKSWKVAAKFVLESKADYGIIPKRVQVTTSV